MTDDTPKRGIAMEGPRVKQTQLAISMDAIDALMESEGLAFPEAVQRLAGAEGRDMTRKARDKIAAGLREAIAVARAHTLTQQIDAVETAARRYLEMAEHSVEKGDELEAVSTALDAAAETLKTLDFARETLR